MTTPPAQSAPAIAWKDARLDEPQKFTATIEGLQVTIKHKNPTLKGGYWSWSVRLPEALDPEISYGAAYGTVRSRGDAEMWAENAAKFARRRLEETEQAKRAKAAPAVSAAPQPASVTMGTAATTETWSMPPKVKP